MNEAPPADKSGGLTVVSEYGILGRVDPKSGQFSLIPPFGGEEFASYGQFLTKYGLAPVCLLETRHQTPSSSVSLMQVLADDCSSAMDTEVAVNQGFNLLGTDRLSTDRFAVFSQACRLLFYLGAARHHLAGLVRAYCDVASQYKHVLSIPGSLRDASGARSPKCPAWVDRLPVSGVDLTVLSMGFAEEIFYEMFALFGSLRATLDAIVPVLARQPGVSLPRGAQRSFHSLHNSLPQCQLPSDVATCIQQQWTAWISDLVEYRDTAFHYQVLSPSPLPYVMGLRAGREVIGISAWLPDNPTARSAKTFTFARQIEYLSYARKAYLAMLGVLLFFLDQLRSS